MGEELDGLHVAGHRGGALSSRFHLGEDEGWFEERAVGIGQEGTGRLPGNRYLCTIDCRDRNGTCKSAESRGRQH